MTVYRMKFSLFNQVTCARDVFTDLSVFSSKPGKAAGRGF